MLLRMKSPNILDGLQHMVDHYTQVDKVLASVGTTEKLNNSIQPVAGCTPAEDLGIQFQNCDSLINFEPFFVT